MRVFILEANYGIITDYTVEVCHLRWAMLQHARILKDSFHPAGTHSDAN